MRRKIIVCAVIITILANLSLVYAGNADLGGYNYYKDISITGKNKYKAVFLDEETYKYANENLSDIRITDDKGDFVPYYINNTYSNSISTQVTYNSNIVRKYSENGDTILDFQITPQKENADILANKMEFDIQGEKYLKYFGVFGSFDGVQWQYITQDSIYKVDNAKKNEILLGDTKRYKYYRIRISDNPERTKIAFLVERNNVIYVKSKDIDITGLRLINDITQSTQGGYEKTASIKFEAKSEGKNTILELKNDNRLRINGINININDDTFNRHFEIYTKQGDQIKNTGVSGELYKLNFKDLNIANTWVNLGTKPLSSEVIQVKIYNQDDKPLNIKGIEAVYCIDKLVFEAKNNEGYKLYSGNTNATKPSYDIETYKTHIEVEPQDVCSLGKVIPLGGTTLPKKTYDYNMIFNVVIVVISLALILVIVLKLRNKNKDS